MIAIYVRCSTTEQSSSEKNSLQEQERAGRGIAMARGASDSSIFVYRDAGVSGGDAIHTRPAGKQMLEDVMPGDTIIASKLDRLFRSASDALSTVEALQRRGIDVILVDLGVDPVTQNGTSKLFFSMLAAFAEFERNRIAERMAEGRRAKAARSGCVGTPMYGQRRVGERGTAMLVRDEREQQIIALVAQLRPTRTLDQIAHELTRRGFTTRAGGPFHKMVVKRILDRMPQQAAE